MMSNRTPLPRVQNLGILCSLTVLSGTHTATIIVTAALGRQRDNASPRPTASVCTKDSPDLPGEEPLGNALISHVSP